MKNPTKVVTGKVRFSYVHVFEPHAMEASQDKKYSVSLLIPKSDKETLSKINNALNIAKEQARVNLGGKLPVKFKLPLNDGDEERPDDAAYAGCYYINANSRIKPRVVDTELRDILDPAEFYSGCYGRASITFFPFNVNGNKGIACALNNLQKLSDGEILGGKSSAEDDFNDDYAAN